MKRSGSSHPKSKLARVDYKAYAGHVISPGEAVACTDTYEDFYDIYVKGRKPVKITGSANHPVDIARLQLSTIVDTLSYPGKLQVERKHGHGFGLGQVRELMTMGLIVEKLALGDDSYYLTTQYENHEVEDGEERGEDEESEEEEEGDEENEGFGSVVNFGSGDDSDTDEDLDKQLRAFSNGQVQDDFEDEIAFSDENNIDDDNDSNSADSIESDEEIDLDGKNGHLDKSETEYADSANRLTADEIDFRVKSLLQPPLTALVHDDTFPITPTPFDRLVTQQINLWMGASQKSVSPVDLLHPTRQGLGRYVPSGNSSGLHHDHADNLYVLLEGRKRFTIYSPADAHTMYTVGNINKVYSNGLIDYKVDKKAPHWRHMREDGAIIAEHARWMFEKDDCSSETRARLKELIANEEVYNGPRDDTLDPPSFSTIPPVLAHLDELTNKDEIQALTEFANTEFPGFLLLNKLEVWLDPGDMLYLPCGWFHEVTSYSTDVSSAHIALNWWFVPPATSDDIPYPDEHWKQDFAKTLASIDYIKQHRT